MLRNGEGVTSQRRLNEFQASFLKFAVSKSGWASVPCCWVTETWEETGSVRCWFDRSTGCDELTDLSQLCVWIHLRPKLNKYYIITNVAIKNCSLMVKFAELAAKVCAVARWGICSNLIVFLYTFRFRRQEWCKRQRSALWRTVRNCCTNS